MRRRLILIVLAVTSMVAVAFAIPLALLVRSAAHDRATSSAEQEARSLAGVLAVIDRAAAVEAVVAQADRASDHAVALLRPDGSQLGSGVEVLPDRVRAARSGQANSYGQGNDHVVLVPLRTDEDVPSVVAVVTDRGALTEGVAGAWATIAALGSTMVLAGVVLADRMARSTVRSIAHLGDVTRRLREGDMDARVQPSGPSEVADVGRAVNDLADEIDALVLEEREAAADLSHRLRTPLTALQLQVESISNESDRAAVAAAVAHLTEDINTVIRAARRPRDERISADLGEVVDRRVAFWRVLARQQQRSLHWSREPGSGRVPVPPEDLAAAVDTLLTNVFQHTPEGTDCTVAVGTAQGRCYLRVEDDGPGMPNGETTLRGASGAGSTGLGLDIVRRTAEATGGELDVDCTPSGGARVELRFGPPAVAGRRR